jgi:hypothetical protein
MGLSSLSGPDYARNTQVTATRDDDTAGRWVAVDESGWDGEQLYRRADRYLSIGSVAVDDESAAQIVDRLRRDAGLSQPPELKFAHFTGQRSGTRLEALAALLGPGGALAGRAHVYLVDKHYFVASKIIDLLLEEEAHARGINLYEGDLARRAAWTLFTDGPRALGGEGFDRIIATMVGFASARNRDGSLVSVDALFEELRLAFGRAYRWEVSQILAALLKTREHAEDYLRARSDNAPLLPAMEPLIAALPLIANLWSDEIGAVTMLFDEHKVLTDERLDIIARAAALDVQFAGPGMGVRRRPPARAVRAAVRGVSRDHPSIQLADLMAGAGQAVARRHAGVPSPAGERLYPLVVPMISPESLVPHDDPERFAAVDQAGLAGLSSGPELITRGEPAGCCRHRYASRSTLAPPGPSGSPRPGPGGS